MELKTLASFIVLSMILASNASSATSSDVQSATPTQAQVESLKHKMANVHASAKALVLWKSASETVLKVTQFLSCYPSFPVSEHLMRYVAPGDEQVAGFIFQGVMDRGAYGGFRYHPKSQCVSVDRIDSVKAKANNALSYRVIFLSDSSGETYIGRYTIARQPDGVWLYTYH